MSSQQVTFSDDETRMAVMEHPGAIGIYSVGESIAAIYRVPLPTVPPPLSTLFLNINGPEHDVDLLMPIAGKTSKVTFWRHREIIGDIVQLTSKDVSGPLFHLSAPPHLRRYHCNISPIFLQDHASPLVFTVDIKPLPLGDHPSQHAFHQMFLVDYPPQDAVVDIRTWSNMTIADGWLRAGSRRICWLPERYRPSMGTSISVFANRVVYGIGETPGSTTERKPMVLALRGIDIHYYDC